MAAGLCGIPGMALHPIPCADPILVLLPQVLLTANIGWAPIPTGGGLIHPTIAINTTQVDYMLSNYGTMCTKWGNRVRVTFKILTLQVRQYYVTAVEEAIHKDDSGGRFKIYIYCAHTSQKQ